jgi:hypothetical protein
MTGIFSFTTDTAVCEGCGNEFTRTDYRQRVCRKNCSRQFQTKRVRFVGVDGEGIGSDTHKYVLLGIGDRHIENPNGLGWKECFSFLYREFLRRGKGHAFVGFFLGYDFTQILKTLPESRARMLLTIEGKALRKHRIKGKQPHPVVCDEWEFDILGYKRLRIRPHDCECVYASCKCKKQPWCYLCDVGGYWQTSFLNVINPKGWEEPVCTEEEYEIVREGKQRRANAVLDDDMRRYMHLEIDLLERAMSVLADGFEEIGIHLSPSQWFGPGQASSAWMKGRVPKRDEWLENQPDWYLDAARMSYFGGWFETFCHGRIYGTTYEYDINSAYPAIIQELPCLLHGEWTQGVGTPPGGEHCLVKARVQVPGFQSRGKRTQHIGAMLHRDKKGNISRPAITEGWYWYSELEASVRAKCVDPKNITYYEWVNYEPCTCLPPFAEISNLYLKRLEVGKNSPLGKGAKLVYNSEYGKFAQSIGEPQFGNPIYASKITSGCRTQILDAIATHPDGQTAVAMVATDAVFFLTPHPTLPISDKLGDWDATERENLTIFKPGVYWDDTTRKMIRERKAPKFKARGINAAQFAEQIWGVDFEFASWMDNGFTGWPTTTYESGFSMITCLQALMRNDWTLAGENDPKSMFQSSNPFRKRGKVYHDDTWNVWRTEIIRPEYDWAEEDYVNVVSEPYVKRFGIEDPFSDESRMENGVTQDGTLSFVYSSLLRNEEE